MSIALSRKQAAKAYEEHCERNGKPSDHAKAKEILYVRKAPCHPSPTHKIILCVHARLNSAGFAGAFIDREVETRGLDFIDREKAKHHGESYIQSARAPSSRDTRLSAKQQLHDTYDQNGGNW